MKRAAALLEEDRRAAARPTPTTTTTVADAFAEWGSRVGDYDHYFGRMRATADTAAYRCQNPQCARAFQAETRQRFCSLACRDHDAGRS